MLERVPDLPGLTLDQETYLRDYWAEYERIGDHFWKLERIQTFREPGDPSWEAFVDGDWPRALELNEADRPTAVEMAEMDRPRNRTAPRTYHPATPLRARRKSASRRQTVTDRYGTCARHGNMLRCTADLSSERRWHDGQTYGG